MASYKGIVSRLKMLTTVIDIALRSLVTGTYVKQGKFLKYNTNFKTILKARDPGKGLTVTEEEAYTLYSGVKATNPLSGCIAEIGVYKGNSATIICEVKNQRDLYLFDTFEGMPNEQISDQDEWDFDTHRDTNLESVEKYLSRYAGVFFVPGVFPDSLETHKHLKLDDKEFSFVHLDVDLYKSTLDALHFFYPRLQPGGRLVSHNYNLKDTDGGTTPGVKKAFFEYFAGVEHQIIEIAETQCLVIKDA